MFGFRPITENLGRQAALHPVIGLNNVKRIGGAVVLAFAVNRGIAQNHVIQPEAALHVTAKLFTDDFCGAIENRSGWGAHTMKRRGFHKITRNTRPIAIDRVGRCKHHLAQPGGTCRFQRILHATDIHIQTTPGVTVHIQGHVGSQQQRPITARHGAQQIGWAHHIALHQSQPRIVTDMRQRLF